MILTRRLAINTLFFLVLVINASCQHNNNNTATPGFPGGKVKLEQFIKKNLQWRQGQLTVEGTVFVSFIVDSLGKINDIKVIKSLCESCDQEAVRIVKAMPDWIPAKRNGEPFSSQAMVSIPFKLSADK